jgi:hypothetical protein
VLYVTYPQVVADPYLGWGTTQDDRFIFRVDLDNGDVPTPLAFSADWAAVTAAAGNPTGGDTLSTGWESATFTINTPPASDPQPGSVSPPTCSSPITCFMWPIRRATRR